MNLPNINLSLGDSIDLSFPVMPRIHVIKEEDQSVDIFINRTFNVEAFQQPIRIIGYWKYDDKGLYYHVLTKDKNINQAKTQYFPLLFLIRQADTKLFQAYPFLDKSPIYIESIVNNDKKTNLYYWTNFSDVNTKSQSQK
ncbi:hypothetical protein EJF36_08030 [Bacillus sp. HMF5848]|uniref:hypothetical protein n=1 Tax=Bacillus sp. HMF5848 TaxID=2495421 RepID=UPI000F78950F|nr:hypothetical protein [Bacillus sp. HMF5848]RSK26813.1 hypothetical protein EJF36_08030 [Bacillus sp. HMF5848]